MVGPRKRKTTPRSGSAGSSRKLPKASEAPTEVASAPATCYGAVKRAACADHRDSDKKCDAAATNK